MFTLGEVIEGLKVGRSYQHMLEDDGGKQVVEPIVPGPSGKTWILFTVAGEAHGGWGGAGELPVEDLNNGRWPQNGWEEFPGWKNT